MTSLKSYYSSLLLRCLINYKKEEIKMSGKDIFFMIFADAIGILISMVGLYIWLKYRGRY